MLLTNENVYYYLTERSLINKEMAVDGYYMVLPLNTRNNILKVILNKGKSLFIKQSPSDATSSVILKREANAYKFLKKNKIFSSISTRLPAILDYDDERNVLVTELVPNSNSLHDHYLTQKTFSPNLAQEQASILSSYHVTLPQKTDVSAFPKSIPWILQLNDHNAYNLFPHNAENGKLIAMIQGHEVLKGHLLELKKEWQQTHFIHGDIKWVNFLLIHNENQQSLKLIDWELADIGDPLWDIAGLLQSYVAAWVFGFDNTNPHSNTLSDKMKAFSLEKMQPSIHILLTSYLQMQNITGEARKKAMLKIIRYTAARIIQTSIEGVVYSPQIYANNVRSIQLACNILSDPETAIKDLLGIK